MQSSINGEEERWEQETLSANSPGEEGRWQRETPCVNSPRNSDRRRESDLPEQPVLRPHSTSLSREIAEQEEWSEVITTAVNCEKRAQTEGEDFNSDNCVKPAGSDTEETELKQREQGTVSSATIKGAQTEGEDFNSDNCVKPAGSDTEETELKQREQGTVSSATIKGTERPGTPVSPAEFIPRSLRDRRRPAKYDDFDTQFVRKVRASRLHSDKLKQSSKTSYIRSRVVWNKEYSSEEERELITQSEVQQNRVIPRIRVLRQSWIETDQSASSSEDQSAAEFSSQESTVGNPYVRGGQQGPRAGYKSDRVLPYAICIRSARCDNMPNIKYTEQKQRDEEDDPDEQERKKDEARRRLIGEALHNYEEEQKSLAEEKRRKEVRDRVKKE